MTPRFNGKLLVAALIVIAIAVPSAFYMFRALRSRPLPACPDPLFAMSPVDMSRATAVLYPGQYRGMDYKAHGGLSFAASRNDEITVRLPMDARLVDASRYLQQGEIQYFLQFRNDCGVGFRFDHLLTLSPEFQAIANKLRPAEPDRSETTRQKTDVFPAGTVVATAVGLPAMNNVGLDFGVYDFRQLNTIAQNSQWAALHEYDWDLAAYGVCWFNLLPAEDVAVVKRLETQYGTDYPIERAVSDYCPAPAGTTLDHEGGRPVPEAR